MQPEMKGSECGFSSRSIPTIIPASLGISISMRSCGTWESTAAPPVPRKAYINAENTCSQGSAHSQGRNTSTQVSRISKMILNCLLLLRTVQEKVSIWKPLWIFIRVQHRVILCFQNIFTHLDQLVKEYLEYMLFTRRTSDGGKWSGKEGLICRRAMRGLKYCRTADR